MIQLSPKHGFLGNYHFCCTYDKSIAAHGTWRSTSKTYHPQFPEPDVYKHWAASIYSFFGGLYGIWNPQFCSAHIWSTLLTRFPWHSAPRQDQTPTACCGGSSNGLTGQDWACLMADALMACACTVKKTSQKGVWVSFHLFNAASNLHGLLHVECAWMVK